VSAGEKIRQGFTVIASEAKQSSLASRRKNWIASSLRSLAQRFAFVAGNDDAEFELDNNEERRRT
jgi:hypothetical protein